MLARGEQHLSFYFNTKDLSNTVFDKVRRKFSIFAPVEKDELIKAYERLKDVSGEDKELLKDLEKLKYAADYGLKASWWNRRIFFGFGVTKAIEDWFDAFDDAPKTMTIAERIPRKETSNVFAKSLWYNFFTTMMAVALSLLVAGITAFALFKQTSVLVDQSKELSIQNSLTSITVASDLRGIFKTVERYDSQRVGGFLGSGVGVTFANHQLETINYSAVDFVSRVVAQGDMEETAVEALNLLLSDDKSSVVLGALMSLERIGAQPMIEKIRVTRIMVDDVEIKSDLDITFIESKVSRFTCEKCKVQLARSFASNLKINKLGATNSWLNNIDYQSMRGDGTGISVIIETNDDELEKIIKSPFFDEPFKPYVAINHRDSQPMVYVGRNNLAREEHLSGFCDQNPFFDCRKPAVEAPP